MTETGLRMFRGFLKYRLLRAQFISNQNLRCSIYNSFCAKLRQNQEEVHGLLAKCTKQSKENPKAITQNLTKKFKHFFTCSEDHAAALVKQNEALIKVPLDKICRNIEILYEKNASAKTIMENLWMVGVSESKST